MENDFLKIIWVDEKDLLDYPKDLEDITDTSDLEESMRQIEFCDPIHVTDFEMEDGKYMIISGRRRRVAGRKFGFTRFPVIVRHFTNPQDVYNYVLLANYHRDSSRDSLLYATRYKMHQEYLKEADFVGNLRVEIAKRLSMSVQQADRYRQFNKLILSVWDMVREKKVAMSSVMPVAPFETDDQKEIVRIMCECLEEGDKLTRPRVKIIVNGYREGKKSYREIIEENDIDKKNANKLMKHFSGINKCFEQTYSFEDEIIAGEAICNMGKTFETVMDNMQEISDTYGIQPVFQELLSVIESKLKKY